jgi:hypothetical protein
MPHRPRPRALRARAAARAALALLALALLLVAPPRAAARLRPYYVVDGASFGRLEPRVLFVLDTSGSMAWQSRLPDAVCTVDLCEADESAGAARSRIHVARQAVRSVVDSARDNARFALMTFDAAAPPTSVPLNTDCSNTWAPASLPNITSRACGSVGWGPKFSSSGACEAAGYGPCTYRNLSGNKNDGWYYTRKSCDPRFWAWFTSASDGSTYYSTALCTGTERPYPYLRWDDLGPTLTSPVSNGMYDLPPSPIISRDVAVLTSPGTLFRRVQWFPSFLGVRGRPDAATAAASVGDYDPAELSGHDFYYWPYVDGFNWYGQYGTGVVDRGSSYGAALFAPFYLADELADSATPSASWGPASDEIADALVLATTAPLNHGGVDAVGGTPWKSVIGSIPASPPLSNAEFAHTTVASYLKFVTTNSSQGLCTPTSAVVMTDGVPSSGEGGSDLYNRLAALRNTLGVRAYVVGFFTGGGGEIAQMACAAAGATGANPCSGTPAKDWDTCRDPANPTTDCAYSADSPDELRDALIEIISDAIELEVPTGPGSAVVDFGAADTADGPLQTRLTARTDWPAWSGHVIRSLCDDTVEDPPGSGNLVPAPYCTESTPAFTPTQAQPTFGPCPQSRSWDAGECLAATPWYERRLYTDDGARAPVPVLSSAAADAGASDEFRAQLAELGLLVGANESERRAHADRVARFLAGQSWPNDWKLPGLANSAPVVVRRIPPLNRNTSPTVAIRDPHCAGRILAASEDVPASLEEFAQAANLRGGSGWLGDHHAYQEIVVVGDDLGLVHAFQYDSGNELWAYIPRFALAGLVAQEAIGASSRGQPDELAAHTYGVAATLNAGWVYDEDAARWRHLGVIGMGAGGKEYVALDLSHASPSAPDGPFEILWTTQDAGLAAAWDAVNSETWSRPALVYEHPDTPGMPFGPGTIPAARLVLGTGYRDGSDGPASTRGRALVRANALTGALLDTHTVALPAGGAAYDALFGLVSDVGVASYCESKFWAEGQEAYVADPAGRLYRWDLGGSDDSGGAWSGTALPAVTFPACRWNGSGCTVSGSGPGDVFTFPPAVSTADRMDDYEVAEPAGEAALDVDDRLLIALASGSPFDDAIDGGDPSNDFVSSLYLLVDDHRTSAHGGFSVPGGAPAMAPEQVGDYPGYLRLPLTALSRTRRVTPYPGAAAIVSTANFGKAARPIRAPRIEVRGVVLDPGGSTPQVRTDVEVFTITYTVYEPGQNACDPAWRNPATGEWFFDEGSTYDIALQLVAVDGEGFDFANPAPLPPGLTGLEGVSHSGLALVGVNQRITGACADGNCGPTPGAPRPVTCDQGADEGTAGSPALRVTGYNELDTFTPME